MELLLLGPVELRVEDRVVPLGGTKQRALAAMLALHVNEVVSRERLVDGLWGDSPPPSAIHTVESYVSRLRRILRNCGNQDVLQTRSPGYVLTLDPDLVDVDRFESLSRDGRRALNDGDPERGARLLSAALDLFRGPPLDDVGFFPFAAAPQARLADERLAALEDRVEADLAAGRAGELVGELQAMVDAHPLRERAHGQLMLALYRVGRQSDALAAFRRARTHLLEELGVEPGSALQELEQAILRHDSALDARSLRGNAEAQVRAGSGAARLATYTRAVGVVGGDPTALAPAQQDDTARTRQLTWRTRPVVLGLVAAGLILVVGLVTWPAHDSDHASPSSSRAPIDAGSVGVLDAATGALLGQLRPTGEPADVAAGDGAVWIADQSTHTVTRVDVARRRTEDSIPLPGDADAIASGGGSIWVAEETGGTVLRLAPATDTVVQRITVGRSPSAIAYGDGRVWVTTADDRSLVGLSPRTGVVLRRIHLDVRPTAVAVGFGSVWVTSASGGAVYRVDPRGSDIATIPVGTGPGPITIDGSGVWVANTLDGTVSRIDPVRDVVTATLVTGDDPDGMVATPAGLWVADQSGGTVVLLDPRTARVTRTVRVGASPRGLAYVGGSLWITTGRSPAAHRGGTLRVDAAIGRLDSIDPGRAFLLFPPQLLGMTNDGLVTLRHVDGADGTQVVPDLASTVPSPTDHGLAYRFAVRQGVRYSNGEPVRIGDFRRGLERDFRIGSPGTGFYSGIVGAGACMRAPRRCRLTRGVTLDPATRSVTFHLTHPDADFLYKLTLTFADAVPPGTPDHDVGRHPIPATGPYVITRYDPGHRLVLQRNPEFSQWSSAAQPDGYPDRIVWRFGQSPESAVSSVERGTADFGLYQFPFSPPGDRLPELRTRYPAQIHANPLPETEFFTLNTRVPPFDDVRVRRALNDAVDRNVVARLDGGRFLASPTCQLLPPGLPGYSRYCPYSTGGQPRGPYRGPRLAAAHRLVAASGTRGMRVRVIADPHVRAAHYVVLVLRHLGYRATVRLATGPRLDLLESNSRFRSQVDLVGWAADYPSPAEFLDYFLSCRAFRPASNTNINTAEFCDRRVDAGIARAERLQPGDPAAATRVWQRVDRRVTDLAPVLSTVNLKAVDFVSRRVGGYEFNPQWGILLDQLWVR